MKQYIPLVVVLILIAGAIFVLESSKTNASTSVIKIPAINLTSVLEKEGKYSKAVEVVNPSGFVNTPNLTVSSLIGKKIILVDFWTYSCINCQRTLPYLNAWYDKYRDQGLEIVSIHTPEFEFEKNISNVKTAVEKFGIKYPVILDNEYGTWTAYSNRYWPHKYLIDIDGYIVYDHIGEGSYEETEKEIQKLLLERQEKLRLNTSVNMSIVQPRVKFNEPTTQVSQETYLGAARNSQIGNGNPGEVGVKEFTLPQSGEVGKYYLSGTWNVQGEYIECISNCSLTYAYYAKNVFLVASSANASELGVKTRTNSTSLNVMDSTLYTLVNVDNYEANVLELTMQKGFRAYAFTFG